MNPITQLLANPNIVYLIVLGGVFIAVLALIFGIRFFLASRTSVVKDRLQRTVSVSSVVIESALPGLEGTDHRDQKSGLFQTAMTSISRLARPTSPEEIGQLRANLSHAGYRGERALVTYLSTKIILCVGFGLLFLWYQSFRQEPMEYYWLYTILVMGLGFYIPAFWLRGRIKERQSEINHALPDALDLVVTCVEGGLGLDSALNRVSEEISLSTPLLSKELNLAALEMRAGISRGQAFRRLAERTGVEEIRNLAAIIVQTDLFGTSISKSLRVQAESIRIRRMQIAEEKAATVGVKLTVPLVFCIMPSLFAVLLGPAVVRIIRTLLPSLTQGG